MLTQIVNRSLSFRVLVLAALALVIALGVRAIYKVPVDAFPDVTPIQVGVVMEAQGMAAEDVERLLTFPIEGALAGLPHVQTIRSVSIFGLSSVTAFFEDETDIYEARRLVAERLLQAKEQLPDGLGEPSLAPNSSGLGQVYWYTVESTDGKRSQQELRTLQDWTIRRLVRTARGVEETVSWGGEEKQYQVLVDANKLLKFGLTLRTISESIAANNRQVGGQYLNVGGEQYLVRGEGLIGGLDDMSNIMVAENEGTPVYLRDVATVVTGPAVRFGAVTKDGKEAVLGIALQRIGENAKAVVEGVKQKLEQVKTSLPPGVAIVPVYDRTELVDAALGTARRALIEGSVLVAIVLFLFLGEIRSSLVVIATLPVAMLIAFIFMQQLGVSANLMSLAGLSVGIGMIVDGAIVMVENTFKHLAHTDGSRESRIEAIRRAATEVIRPIVFAIAIIIVVFLPLFTLSDIEGKMFKPMALTITFAMVGSLLLSLVVVPVVCSLVLRPQAHSETRLVRWLMSHYRNLLGRAMAARKAIFAVSIVALVAAAAVLPFLGREFMPNLQEGSFLIRMAGIPSTSLEESIRTSIEAEKVLSQMPEVATALGTIGRAERGEAEDVSRIEMVVTLKPRDGWPRALSFEELGARMQKALQERLPTMVIGLSQPIQMRVEELISGVRAPLAFKLYGEDLATLDRIAGQVREVLEKVPGVAELTAEANSGKPTITIKVNRQEAARFGLSADDVLDVVHTGIGGKAAGVVLEGEKRFDIEVRLAPEFRSSIAALSALPIRTRTGAQVPLSRVADIRTSEGYSFVRHEQLQRVAILQLSVEGRDTNGFVQDANARIREAVKLPAGYRYEWGGSFENQQRALARLAVIVPLTIAFIFVLLYVAFGTLRHAVIIIANVPFALVGGVLALFASGQYLSVPSAIGFIAVFGVAMLNGIVLVSFMIEQSARGVDPLEAATTGAEQRLRPILMTALVTILGLLPMLLSSGIGAETQRPLATVVMGGLLTSTALTLFLLPLIYEWVETRRQARLHPISPRPLP